jgi:hypothetical protein
MTMRAHIASVVTSIALVIILVASAFAAPGAKLAPDDIQTTFFNGQPFVAATQSNVKFKMTFSADGKMKREPASGGGAKGEGTWKLSKDGFCTTWNGARANCFTIVSVGESKWSVLKGSTIMATWSK